MNKDRQEIRDKTLAKVSPSDLIRVMVEMYGIKHTFSMIGWAVSWGARGIENGPEFRATLKENGLSRTTAYRISLDYRRLGDELEKRYGAPVDSDIIYNRVMETEIADYIPKGGTLVL